MPDDHDDRARAADEFDLDYLVARVSNLYGRRKLSPPSNLREVAKSWRGISVPEIVEAIEAYFDANLWRFSSSGSGDQFFGEVSSAVRAAWQQKHPAKSANLRSYARDRADDDQEPPRRRSSSRVRKIHNASGFPPDMFVEGRAARLLRDQPSNVERPSGLPGYEDAGVPIGDDDEADA